MFKSLSMTAIAALLLVSLSACESVKPWHKDKLAKAEMGFVVDPLEAKMSDHVYFAKEATASGAEVAGGGCGCN
ncbi:DUF4266 domain-containing protein [Agaribacterium haliotis]|uniref:DUF4266 domain-containing protein n=1 Tax=Agaribacterium haliotis TaxID=2013869 RepID=UPI001EFCC5FF|nr:DUF4266 domain-containing protein [Agaribacterium haliotis]